MINKEFIVQLSPELFKAKIEIEKELQQTRNQNELLIEKQRTTDVRLSQIMELVKQLEAKIRVGGDNSR